MKPSDLILSAQVFIQGGHWEASEDAALRAVADHKMDVQRAWPYVEAARESIGDGWMDKDPFDILEVALHIALGEEQ